MASQNTPEKPKIQLFTGIVPTFTVGMPRTRAASPIAAPALLGMPRLAGLVDLDHDIFTMMAETGDAFFLSRVAKLSKAHRDAARAAWPRLATPFPLNVSKQVANLLTDELKIGDDLDHPDVNDARVASLLTLSGKTLAELGVQQICKGCHVTRDVPHWDQCCDACWGDAIKKGFSDHDTEKVWYELSMWKCDNCDLYNSEKGLAEACDSCGDVYHKACHAFCPECDGRCMQCCDCDEWEGPMFELDGEESFGEPGDADNDDEDGDDSGQPYRIDLLPRIAVAPPPTASGMASVPMGAVLRPLTQEEKDRLTQKYGQLK